MNQSVSVLIPVFNNASSLDELYRRLVSTLESTGRIFEIIFINDGSSDESALILRRTAKTDPRCVVLALSRNFGQHPAISAGLARARGELTVLMDADLQDRPEELPQLLAQFDVDDELDIVYTIFDEADHKERLTSRLFHGVYARLSGVEIPSRLGTYRVFTSDVRLALLDYRERNAVYGPLMAQMGYKYVYAGVHRDTPVGRKTSYNFRRRLSLAISSILSYGHFLHRFVSWTGLVLTVVSGGYLAVILVQYVTGPRTLVNGQLLLLVITVLMSGVLLMTVGLLSAYTYRIFEEVLARPRFHVAREHGRGIENDRP